LEHFTIEDGEIIDAASDAFSNSDLSNFGTIVDRSQKLCADILGNQIPETISLAVEARKNGAYAASSFGAGFGGAVWALVDKKNAERFIDTWQVAYSRLHPESARMAQYFFSCPGPAAFNLS
jgi:galactokinase